MPKKRNIFLSEIDAIRQSKKDLRNFGIVFFAAGFIFAGLSYYKHGWESKMIFIFSGTGTIFLLLGFFLPGILKPLHKAWMVLAVILGYFFSRIILAVTFIFAIIPVGLIMRIFKKDILDLSAKQEDKSFWKDYQNSKDKERYKKMF